eukprot:8564053-Ditylum_brightwellii.AAC.1
MDDRPVRESGALPCAEETEFEEDELNPPSSCEEEVSACAALDQNRKRLFDAVNNFLSSPDSLIPAGMVARFDVAAEGFCEA